MKQNKKFEAACWALVLLPLVLAAVCWPTLPDVIPGHWNVAGEIDAWAGKGQIFLFPLISAACNLLFMLLPKLDPKKENYERFEKVYRIFRVIFLLFMLLMSVMMLIVGYDPYAMPMEKGISVAVGLMFLVLGNYMPKFKHNYFVGIKTPWTLASEQVWNRTHRLGGYCFAAAGAAIFLAALLTRGELLFGVMMGAIILCILPPLVASYIWYKKEKEAE